MVAVPGRSKGCATCRKRRVKCDEAKPTCTRCTKAGYTCAGYARPLEIRFAPTCTPDSKLLTASTSTSAVACTQERPRHFINRTHPAPPPPELPLVAFRDDMCASYLFSNFVWRTYGDPWLELAVRGKLGQLPLDASRALAFTHFGSSHHENDTKNSGSIAYGSVLKRVGTGLANPRGEGLEWLIIPVLMMLIHASSQADRMGAVSHVKGLTQLLYICGPEKFQIGPLRHAFESCRATLITTGLISRQRCFLEQESWRTVPWENDRVQSPQTQLVKILVFVPGFLQDDVELDRDFDKALHADLVARVEQQLEFLFTWRWRWHQANGPAVWEQFIEEKGPLAVKLCFDSLGQGVEIVTYNAVLIWLLGLLWKLDPANTAVKIKAIALRTKRITRSTQPGCCPIGLPGDSIELRDISIELCRVFEYLANNVKNNQVSSLFFLMPIGLAWSVLEVEPEWKVAIEKCLCGSSITRGYQMGQNVFGFGSYAFPRVLRPKGAPPTLWLSHSNRETAWSSED